MYQSYKLNFFAFYQAFESFEMNFKHLSGEKWKNVWMTSIKKRKKNTVALFIRGLSLGASWLLEHLWSYLWKESNDEIQVS